MYSVFISYRRDGSEAMAHFRRVIFSVGHLIGCEDSLAQWWMNTLRETEHLYSLDPRNYIKHVY